MKYLTPKFLLSALLLNVFMSTHASADDNIANCEIVVQQPINADAEKNSAQIATFLPAGNFIFSVFNANSEHLTEIDGKPIRAVMCTRNSVVPSEFDLKVIRTGIPLYLSPNFDAKESPFLGISKLDGKYVYDYIGSDLSKDELELLTIRMKALNDAKN